MKPTKISISMRAAQHLATMIRLPEDAKLLEIDTAICEVLNFEVIPHPPWVAALEAGEAAQRETDAKASVHYDKLALLATIGLLCQAVRDAYGVKKDEPKRFTIESLLLKAKAVTREGVPVELFRNRDASFPLAGWVGDGTELFQWDRFGNLRQSVGEVISKFDLFVKP